MRGNSFGKMITMTSFGESHGPAMGVVIDGVPSNLPFSLDDLKSELERRAPGRLEGTTTRFEEDSPEVLSGVFEGKTLGSPIAVLIKNNNQRSGDYEKLKDSYRPGHADKTTMQKFGIRDHRGGGRSSGRETVSRVVGGYFASLIMPNLEFTTYISKLGPYETKNVSDINSINKYYVPNVSDEETKDFLLGLKEKGESVGGVVSVKVSNCPEGLGEPAFDKLKADLGKALLSIGACVGFTFGKGHEMTELYGSDISKDVNSFGGMEGGISNGDDLFLQVFFKPTSTIGEKAKEGRHDPCIIPRAIPVVEAMIRFVLADHFLRQKAYQL